MGPEHRTHTSPTKEIGCRWVGQGRSSLCFCRRTIMEWVRNIVANRLAATGLDWPGLYGQRTLVTTTCHLCLCQCLYTAAVSQQPCTTRGATATKTWCSTTSSSPPGRCAAAAEDQRAFFPADMSGFAQGNILHTFRFRPRLRYRRRRRHHLTQSSIACSNLPVSVQ